ncbi:MAG: DNA polymerase IV [Bacteroidota bacterium]|nr:DNA polymerase IV [Bacteroidota bacterium]
MHSFHNKTENRAVMHLDMDSFFTSVELLLNPSLIGKPVIVGGNKHRGVVGACSYEARKFGVASGMSSANAYRLCPSAIFLSGNNSVYGMYSNMVTEMIAQNAPSFEKSSIDEFYLELTGMDSYFGIRKWSFELANKISKEVGLPLSIGVAINKTTAKMATEEGKPKGRIYLKADQIRAFLDPLTVNKIPMAGPKSMCDLNKLGIFTIKDLREFSFNTIKFKMGRNGMQLWLKANGIDNSEIERFSIAKSISKVHTLHDNSRDKNFLLTQLNALTEEAMYNLRAKGMLTGCISVKLRTFDFKDHETSMQVEHTSIDDVILLVVNILFYKLFKNNVSIRLVGIKLTKLVNSTHQLKLFDAKENQNNSLMKNIDFLRDKYGLSAVSKANGIHTTHKIKSERSFNFMNG